VRDERIDELYKNSLINPLHCLKNTKFIDTFIEKSERDAEEVEIKQQPTTPKNSYKKRLTISAFDLPHKIIIEESDYTHSKFEALHGL
jgi:hypothetical protein